ncbi:hypothetical protein [Secundilactobacillus yichangensis]|uniref:hypothetical protein n=1 Tax=Secundilactobacillus yichangensis TaxID=2799580 RepID=UPI00194156B9|nr:hypothetical protein [Secundilactobacillus yichangensis]
MQLTDLVVPLYHIDTSEHNEKFCKGSFFPSNEQGEWCGKGMYFWETFSNANKWLVSRSDNTEVKFSMASASLRCNKEDILDLTNVKSSEALYSIAQLLAAKYDVGLDLSKIGAVINFVHETLALQQASKNFSVVKIFGSYPRNHSHGLVAYIESKMSHSRRVKSPHATELVKIIYAVRENELLHDRKIIDPQEEAQTYEFSI